MVASFLKEQLQCNTGQEMVSGFGSIKIVGVARAQEAVTSK
jgi:hypothetical protein